MDDVAVIRAKFEVLRPFLDERRRRLWAAAEALVRGHGGITAVATATGLQRATIRVGMRELQASPAATEYASGAVREVSGLRVFTFFYPDEKAVTDRFVQHGYPAPQFQPARNGRRIAMVLDPENQWVELVIAPGAPPSTYESMEVGITVTDLEKSRAFYREFVGLEELPPVDDSILGTKKYPFRHGTTTINVWSFGKTARANTRSAGIQYVVNDVEAVDAKAKAQSVKIDTPLGNFSQTLRTIWLSDPDGVTNYFAQIMRRTAPAPDPSTR